MVVFGCFWVSAQVLLVSADPGDQAIVGRHQSDLLKCQARFHGLFKNRRLISHSPGRIPFAQGGVKTAIALADVVAVDAEGAVNAKGSTAWQHCC